MLAIVTLLVASSYSLVVEVVLILNSSLTEAFTKNISDSMNDERLEHNNQINQNRKLNLEIESLKTSRQSQVDEMSSILADLEPLLENTGETNA